MKIKSLLLIAVLGLAAVAGAQGVTTGSLSGVVTDPNGEPLPGANVVATLSATGTRYTAVTDAMGVFRIINTRVGGPYEVTADLAGFQPQTANDVRVLLGETTFLEMTLQLEAATGEIVVVGQASDLINPTRMGVASSVSERTLDSMPTVERNLYDFARTNPVFSTFSPEEDATVLSVAGRNPRYNNISIDGAVNNDVFGLAASGTPGGQSRVQPIQLDAVQELQLVTSSFDVRQGGFTGGSVNVITKSGSNEFHGGVFGYTSSDSWVGDGPDFFNEFGTYDDLEYGFLLGGPIVKDKAFFFVNYGRNELDEPTGWSLDGSSGQAWQNGNFVAEAEEFRQFNIDTYGYDPGGLGEKTIETPSDKFFVRFDLNLDTNNTLTARYNYVDASNVLNRPDDGSYEWPNEAYDFTNETNSLVAQWNA
ncbi:MAG TPA: TonB-dependent receptor, partial [Candidatus Sulfomarinibacteraceae bacterium]|nr:TonB-dependent receptor [Candidatus Sulfomarinibacteraceae bacterium]